MTKTVKHLRLVWDADACYRECLHQYYAWKAVHWRAMQARDDKKRAERRAKREAREAAQRPVGF